MVGRIFRRRVRGSGKPSAALLELARALERNGLQAAPLPGEAAEGRAGLAGGARSLGLLADQQRAAGLPVRHSHGGDRRRPGSGGRGGLPTG